MIHWAILVQRENPMPAEDFIEALYLALNPDVAAAVIAGKFFSGRQHWEQFGRRESEEGSRPALTHEAHYAHSPSRAVVPEREAGFLDTTAYLYLHPDVQAAIGNDADAARRHWIDHGRFEARRAPGVASFRRRHIDLCKMSARPFGLNVFGPFMAKTGLGTACRNMLAAIEETKLPFDVWSFDTSKGAIRFAELDKQRRPRFNINIIFANAEQIEQVYLAAPEAFF